MRGRRIVFLAAFGQGPGARFAKMRKSTPRRSMGGPTMKWGKRLFTNLTSKNIGKARTWTVPRLILTCCLELLVVHETGAQLLVGSRTEVASEDLDLVVEVALGLPRRRTTICPTTRRRSSAALRKRASAR